MVSLSVTNGKEKKTLVDVPRRIFKVPPVNHGEDGEGDDSKEKSDEEGIAVTAGPDGRPIPQPKTMENFDDFSTLVIPAYALSLMSRKQEFRFWMRVLDSRRVIDGALEEAERLDGEEKQK
eukprot:TRINITY_DN2218_c0_g3_i2.p1 TRINITY_DN2218_c0_g3~~TRINITY_DN2218_c0_g3_i2.p1  ORF type:complete len:121 (+),score=28.63 TRINITY_DN2218_c0_g3_i2:119-481(+)